MNWRITRRFTCLPFVKQYDSSRKRLLEHRGSRILLSQRMSYPFVCVAWTVSASALTFKLTRAALGRVLLVITTAQMYLTYLSHLRYLTLI